MALVAFINIIILLLAIFFVYFLFVLFYRHTKRRHDLKSYLSNAVLLTSSDREAMAADLANEEFQFRRSTNTFLIVTLAALTVFCLLIFFAPSNTAFVFALFIVILIGLLVLLSYRMSITFRNRKLVDQLPNAIELIIHYTLNNISIREIIKLVAKEAPKPIAFFFREVDNRIVGGETIAEALRKTARGYKIFELNYFVMVLILQLDTGADATKVLRRLVEFLRREKILQQRIRGIKADINAVQWGLPLLILAMVIITYLLKPEYLYAILASPLGVKLIIVAIVLFILGVWLIQRVTRVI